MDELQEKVDLFMAFFLLVIAASFFGIPLLVAISMIAEKVASH